MFCEVLIIIVKTRTAITAEATDNETMPFGQNNITVVKPKKLLLLSIYLSFKRCCHIYVKSRLYDFDLCIHQSLTSFSLLYSHISFLTGHCLVYLTDLHVPCLVSSFHLYCYFNGMTLCQLIHVFPIYFVLFEVLREVN